MKNPSDRYGVEVRPGGACAFNYSGQVALGHVKRIRLREQSMLHQWYTIIVTHIDYPDRETKLRSARNLVMLPERPQRVFENDRPHTNPH